MNIINPFYNNVLVKQVPEAEEKMYGHIIMADSGKEKSTIAEVVAVGPGTRNIGSEHWIVPTAVVGDLVLMPSFGGHKVTYEGIDYIIIKDNDILAKINKTNE